jgi:uncharacterized protein
VEALATLPTPLLTCWPVITEACWMLRSRPGPVRQLLGSVGTAFLDLLPLSADEAERVGALMARYENLDLQLADACLIYLAHRENIDTVFTLHRRDFSVYRTSLRKPFHLVP